MTSRPPSGSALACALLALLSPTGARAAPGILFVTQQQPQLDPHDLAPVQGSPRQSPIQAQPVAPPAPSDVNDLTTLARPLAAPIEAAPDGWKKFIDGVDLFYGVFFNGPAIAGTWGTTWGAFQQDTWPMYLYHTLDAQYRFDHLDYVGVEISMHQDFPFNNVTPSTWSQPTAPATPSTYFNDPQFWYKRKAVLDNGWFSTDLQLDLWPGVTDYSRLTLGEYFSTAVDSTWNLKLSDRRWTIYFTTRARPYFYANLQPGDTYNRDWMDLGAGYYFGYNLSNSWQVNVSGLFDCDFYANTPQSWNVGQYSNNTAQLELNYYAGRYARIGAFFQTVSTNPLAMDSIFGLDITINLLTSYR